MPTSFQNFRLQTSIWVFPQSTSFGGPSGTFKTFRRDFPSIPPTDVLSLFSRTDARTTKSCRRPTDFVFMLTPFRELHLPRSFRYFRLQMSFQGSPTDLLEFVFSCRRSFENSAHRRPFDIYGYRLPSEDFSTSFLKKCQKLSIKVDNMSEFELIRRNPSKISTYRSTSEDSTH